MATVLSAGLAATQKDANRREWGRTAEQYAGNMQQGPGIMMPLAVKYMEALSGNKESLQILDIAGGTGIPSITIAKEHPEVFVTVTDLAPGMVAMAQAMAQAQGVSNVRCEAADAENLNQFSKASFDVVTCNLGLMFCPHPEKALSEFRRVLKPDGRLMFVVWGKEDDFKVYSIMKRSMAKVAPGETFFCDPTCLGDKEKLTALVRQAGFSNVTCKEVNVPMAMPASKLRPVFLDNAVVSELLNRMRAQGQIDIYEQAEQAALAEAATSGYLQGEELNMPENKAFFVEAHA